VASFRILRSILDHPLLRHRYEERFDGVLLAHNTKLVDEDNKDEDNKDNKGEVEGKKKVKKVKILRPKILRAKILNGLVPYFGVRVHSSLLVFSPKPDMILEGKVEMLRKGSIHAVILGIFSVAIMSDDISEKFKFKRKSDGGRFVSRSDRQHVIKRGTMIRFLVKGYGLILFPFFVSLTLFLSTFCFSDTVSGVRYLQFSPSVFFSHVSCTIYMLLTHLCACVLW